MSGRSSCLTASNAGLRSPARWPRHRSCLLLDEPTAGMNSSEAHSLMALFKELVGRHVKAILLIEHNMRVVMGDLGPGARARLWRKNRRGTSGRGASRPARDRSLSGSGIVDWGMLKVNAIHVYYGAIHALKGVSFAVEQGELVTLLGANGAGKTTTLKTLSGLVAAARGASSSKASPRRQSIPMRSFAAALPTYPKGEKFFPVSPSWKI